jgi:hypothetical protein
MKVCRTVAPTIHVYLGDLVERADCAFEPYGHHAKFGGEQIREIAEIEM